MVRVTNTRNGRGVDVRINDRGPFADGRVIDLSVRAARVIDLVRSGVAPVKLKVLNQAAVPRPAFEVQVAAFEDQRAAEDLKQRLEKKYPSVTIQTFFTDRRIYRVRIGEPDIEAANRVISELRKEDLKPFIVRAN